MSVFILRVCICIMAIGMIASIFGGLSSLAGGIGIRLLFSSVFFFTCAGLMIVFSHTAQAIDSTWYEPKDRYELEDSKARAAKKKLADRIRRMGGSGRF